MSNSDTTERAAYEDGRKAVWLEAAQALEMKQSEIRLHAGEMTAGEMRAVQAILAWKARELVQRLQA